MVVASGSYSVRMVPPAVLLVPVFGLWNNEFCIAKESWFGSWVREEFGGRGDLCLAGTHSGIILIYVAMNLPFVIWILFTGIAEVGTAGTTDGIAVGAFDDGASVCAVVSDGIDMHLTVQRHVGSDRHSSLFDLRGHSSSDKSDSSS